MKVKDIMTKEVVTIKEDDTVKDAARILNDMNLSGLPVVDVDNKIKGIITDGDLLRRVSTINGPSYVQLLGGGFPLESKKDFLERLNKSIGYLVKEMMTKDVIIISENAGIEEAATLMVSKKIKRIPVADDKKKLIGIISRKDIMKHLFDSY